MIHDFIEEDFRFATRHQIDEYSEADKIWKPHVPGIHLAHLTDSMATYMNRPGSRGRVFVQGPGGTVLSLLRHLQQYASFRFARAFIDPKYCSETLLSTVALLPNVSVTVSTDIGASVDVCDRIDCWCITSLDRLQWCEHLVYNPMIFETSDLLVFDPLRALRDSRFGGKYFMNTQVWVRTLSRS